MAVVCVKSGYYFSSSMVFGRCVEEKWKDSRKKVTLFFSVMNELSIINVFGLE